MKDLNEYLQNPEELTGDRKISRSKRVLQLIKLRNNSKTPKNKLEKINRILNRMTGKKYDRYLAHPADDREMERRNREEL